MKQFRSISEFHEFVGLPRPHHPLISVIDVGAVPHSYGDEMLTMLLDFYCISVKRMGNVKMKYGHQSFDFNDGIMSFMAPRQVFGIAVDNKEADIKRSGRVIYIHPDFLWHTPLAKTIRTYEFWDYALNESLFLSAREEATVNAIIGNIEQEYSSGIDAFSKRIIVSQLEGLLSYADRFYHRQFITREKANHQILDQLNDLLSDYFNSDDLIGKGLPTVRYVAEQLHLSPNYLSSVLRVLTGQNTQQHIHERLIEKAKEKLSTSNLTVSEIAYELGFEHLPSFSKLFKTKTNQSPLAFRASFS